MGTAIDTLCPKLAGISDKFAVLRTLHTQSNDHGIAGTIGLTGNGAGGTGLDGKHVIGDAATVPAGIPPDQTNI